ncbi:MAG: hypothetical protein KGP01_06585 [Actinomycetales bacterium]|nr:hypothetical protein [Actinomycetales bacterium]
MRQPLLHSHRFALEIISETPALKALWEELLDVILTISDEDIIAKFEGAESASAARADEVFHISPETPEEAAAARAARRMSISDAINRLLDERLVVRGWVPQSAIFQGDDYRDKRWRLDFAKTVDLPMREEGRTSSSVRAGMAVEVAFNHGEAIAWNLLKPVMAAELNHVPRQTDIGAGIGVIITASQELKVAGGFDGAVGEYEKFLRYLDPMRNQLTVPLVLVGLRAPETFRIEKRRDELTGRNSGSIVRV